MPMTRLDISTYSSFDSYLEKAFKSKRRNEFRRKLKAAQRLGKLELGVSTSASDAAEDLHSLYLRVFERAPFKFEKLTAAFFRQIGQKMPDKARFFIWRLNGNIVAFSLCLVEGDTLFGEYLGLDYSVAMDLNLYFKIMSDTIAWAIANGFKAIASTGLSYEPKLHMHHALMPLDLYVRHTSPLANIILKPLLRLLGPTKNDPVLRRFPNYHELYG
jgi:predicted N-acyltransferase